MGSTYQTVKDILAITRGVTYSRVNRAVVALEEAGIIHPWRGEANGRRFTVDDGLRVKRFLALTQDGKTLETALAELRTEILEDEIERLREENQHLRALVEVRPEPWWLRLIRRALVLWRPSRSAATVSKN
jgi:DNA-binding MarR family transcriptional regulator